VSDPAQPPPATAGLTPGDPLGGPGHPPGYTSPAPPGAGGLPPAQAPAWAPGAHRLAGWWRRAAAAVVDILIIFVLASIVLVPLGVGLYNTDSDRGIVGLIVAIVLTVVLVALIGLVYAPVMLWKTDGRTVGRLLAGTRLIRADGRPMDFTTAVVREIVLKLLATGVLNAFTIGLPWATLLDNLWPLWDEENRALHDFPVNTRTVLV
jgi:uncharacterized RDD family membrane protein YckC